MRPRILHAATILPAHVEKHVRELPERAAAHLVHQHVEHVGVLDHRAFEPLEHWPALDGNRYLAENPDVSAYVDANVGDFLGSRSNGAIAHFIIYGNNVQRIAYDTAGAAVDMGYVL